jgi:hypothetical protein
MDHRPRSLAVAAVALGALGLPATALAARGALLHPATAHRAAAHRTHKLPVITAIGPRRLTVGQTLRLRGRHFVVGARANTVVFRRAGGRYVFVKARLATSRHLWVTVPTRLRSSLTVRHGSRVATRFRLRVLSRRFAAHFTSRRLSPVVVPPRNHKSSGSGSGSGAGGGTGAPPGATPPPPTPAAACSGLTPGADHDADGLTNGLELQLQTDPCRADTDGDTLSDFWEYKAGLDYNSTALPYPGERPYANALDPSDADIDHDGDGLTARDEYRVWARWGSKNIATPLFLSDGTQSSGGLVAVASGNVLDLNQSGYLTDDERDSDLGDATGRNGDGLGNWDEAHGRMTPEWWAGVHSEEVPYGLSTYAKTDYLDPDTDGDGVRDGADDVDHDGYSNQFEMSRATYWNQPFNPCLPARYSGPVRTCSLHVPVDPSNRWPPFDRATGSAATPFSMSDPEISPAPLR